MTDKHDKPKTGTVFNRIGDQCPMCPVRGDLVPYRIAGYEGVVLCRSCGHMSMPDIFVAQAEATGRMALALETLVDRLGADPDADRQLRDVAHCVHEAWDAFQNAGVMNETTGRTGNEHLDVCASKLDEAAMLLGDARSQKVEGT